MKDFCGIVHDDQLTAFESNCCLADWLGCSDVAMEAVAKSKVEAMPDFNVGANASESILDTNRNFLKGSNRDCRIWTHCERMAAASH